MTMSEGLEAIKEEVDEYIKMGQESLSVRLVNAESVECVQNLIRHYSTVKGLTLISATDSRFGQCPDYLPSLMEVVKYFEKKSREGVKGKFIVTGFGTLLKFYKKEDAEAALRELLINSFNFPLVFILYQQKKTLESLISQDERRARNILLCSSEASFPPDIYYIKKSDKKESGEGIRCVDGIEEVIAEFERMEGGSLYVRTEREVDSYFNSLLYIRDKTNSYANLLSIDGTAKGVSREFVADKLWERLYNETRKIGSVKAVIKEKIGINCVLCSIPSICSFLKDGEYSDYNLFLFYIYLKTPCPLWLAKSVAERVKQGSDLQNLPIYILLSILDEDCLTSTYWQDYDTWSKIASSIKLTSAMFSEYYNRVREKGDKKLYYLTSNLKTEDEEEVGRKKVIATIAQEWSGEVAAKELLSVLKHIDTSLYLYLKDCDRSIIMTQDGFDPSFILSYIQEYKEQKLTNFLHPSFLKSVEDKAKDSTYITSIKMRSEVLHNIKKERSAKLHFIDALGIEYISYIVSKIKESNLSVSVFLCRAQLPSITSINKEFVDNWKNELKKDGVEGKKIREYVSENLKLDALKHEGNKDIYENNKDAPYYISKELGIIDAEIKRIEEDAQRFSKVYIATDHGSSRLCVLANKTASYTMESKGEHSGRCCPKQENEAPPCLNAISENGYWILKDYERFKGGRQAQIETHGGGSIEEVVIPFFIVQKKAATLLVIKVNDGNPITFKFNSSIVIKLYSSIQLEKLGEGGERKVSIVKKDGKEALTLYSALPIVSTENKNLYNVTLPNLKPGEYTLILNIGEGEEASTSFIVKSGGMTENSMGI